MDPPKFDPGQMLATPGALEALAKNDTDARPLLARHLSGDWGELCDEDRQANEDALKTGARLLSAYTLADGTMLWIITEAAPEPDGPRPATTLLLPDEY